jgi:hypothetical protein
MTIIAEYPYFRCHIKKLTHSAWKKILLFFAKKRLIRF